MARGTSELLQMGQKGKVCVIDENNEFIVVLLQYFYNYHIAYVRV